MDVFVTKQPDLPGHASRPVPVVVVGDDLPGPPTVVTDELGEGSREGAGALGGMEVVRDQGVLDVAGQDEDAAVGVAPLVGIEVLPGAPVEDRVLVGEAGRAQARGGGQPRGTQQQRIGLAVTEADRLAQHHAQPAPAGLRV